MKSERILGTFLLAVIGLIILAVFRPSSPDPTEDSRSREAWFFINKTHQQDLHDCVILGDSRGLRGVSPGVMRQILSDLDIFNFSFHAGGMNKEMYDATEALLDPEASRRIIILAPTALSFMPEKISNAQYHEYLHKPWDQVWLYQHAPWVADWFQPLSPSLYLRRGFHIQPHVRLFQTFYPDGWIETDQVPRDHFQDLTRLKERMTGNHVDPAQIRDFMYQTTDWTERGIKVLAFFPPAYAPRIAVEDSIALFDPEAFKADFTRAGGIWLDIPDEDFETYDGSHLVGSSARILSRDLAKACAAVLY